MNDFHDEQGRFASGPGGLKGIKSSAKGQDVIHAMAADSRVKGYAEASIRNVAWKLQSDASGTTKAYQAKMAPRFVAKAAAMHAAAIKVTGSAKEQMAAVRAASAKHPIRIANPNSPVNGGWGSGPSTRTI